MEKQRTIKFRGKHIHTLPQNKKLDGIWVYGYLCSKNYIWSDELGGEMIVDSKTIGQYTGLKDKNGKEIYEGDIINRKCIIEDINYEVIFKNGGYYGKRKNTYDENENVFLKLFRTDMNDIEVIGNIYSEVEDAQKNIEELPNITFSDFCQMSKEERFYATMNEYCKINELVKVINQLKNKED